jgi:hypothetical protein
MAKRPTSDDGHRGLRGERGATGTRGAMGAQGVPGPAGPAMNRADILAMVEDQFVEMRKEMALQLARMAQMQVQLDQIHSILKKLASAS